MNAMEPITEFGIHRPSASAISARVLSRMTAFWLFAGMPASDKYKATEQVIAPIIVSDAYALARAFIVEVDDPLGLS